MISIRSDVNMECVCTRIVLIFSVWFQFYNMWILFINRLLFEVSTYFAGVGQQQRSKRNATSNAVRHTFNLGQFHYCSCCHSFSYVLLRGGQKVAVNQRCKLWIPPIFHFCRPTDASVHRSVNCFFFGACSLTKMSYSLSWAWLGLLLLYSIHE